MLRKEFLADRSFSSLKVAQGELDAWVADYNNERPHQSLEMQTPATRFRSIPREKDAQAVVDSEDDTPGQWILRRVASNGIISVDNQIIGVGNGNKGLLVDVFVDRGVIQVWHKNHLLKTVARQRSGLVRKIRSDGLHVKDQPKMKRKASGDS